MYNIHLTPRCKAPWLLTEMNFLKEEDDAMARTMTPSMTDGQIDKAGDIVRAALCKHLREQRSEFESEPTQQVLGNPALGPKLLAVFRQMYEAVSGLIMRHVKVNRARTPQEALDALGRAQYTDREVVETMPRGDSDEDDDVLFFQGSRYLSDDELEEEFESRGFVPADPYLVAAVNQDDPSFADERPNATHWKDDQGRWCYLACYRFDGERGVRVSRYGFGWFDFWWFAGVRKESLDS